LQEQEETNDRQHAGVTRGRLKRDGDVASSCVDDALGNDRTVLGHGVLMLVCDDFLVQLADFRRLGGRVLVVLDENQSQSNEGTLAHKVDRVLCHGLEEVDGGLETGAGAGDTQGDRGTVADMRVVRLCQKLDHRRALLWPAEEHKAAMSFKMFVRTARGGGKKKEKKKENRRLFVPKRDNCSATDIVTHIGYSHVKESANGIVVCGASVGHANRAHATIAEDGILMRPQLVFVHHFFRFLSFTLSPASWSMRVSAASSVWYMTRARPTAMPRMIFSCCVSRAYWS